MVVGKREMVLGVEPTVVRAAQAFKGSALNHLNSPAHTGEVSWWPRALNRHRGVD
jgi:hypothetical protein